MCFQRLGSSCRAHFFTGPWHDLIAMCKPQAQDNSHPHASQTMAASCSRSNPRSFRWLVMRYNASLMWLYVYLLRMLHVLDIVVKCNCCSTVKWHTMAIYSHHRTIRSPDFWSTALLRYGGELYSWFCLLEYTTLFYLGISLVARWFGSHQISKGSSYHGWIDDCQKLNNNQIIYQDSIQIISKGQKLLCPGVISCSQKI